MSTPHNAAAATGAGLPKAGPAARVWESRTGSIHPDLLAYSESIDDDRPYLVPDLAGSVAHVVGLRKAGLLSDDEAVHLVEGLQSIFHDAEADTFVLERDLEDVHMNIEARLTTRLGETGKRLHTGRSRNDQVATCIVLYARLRLAELAQATNGLAAALASQAKAHATTPWVARTHGQPAQPATLGFLLAAHASRAQESAARVLRSFDAIGESPLGSGAVAGSTLPLQPAYVASRLGLRPPRSALLSTGTRDQALEAVRACADAGFVLSSLAQDLMDLFARGAIQLPAGYTTGSSLMPQKRNPDALELARGHGKALQGELAVMTNLLVGLGLGYQRDMQLAKPILTRSLASATGTAQILTACVEGMTVDRLACGAGFGSPAIVATDVAEALVGSGMPFREAYAVVARAYALVEGGKAFPDALAAQSLTSAALEAALGCMVADPARRATLGGPAPAQVLSLATATHAACAVQATAVAAALRQAAVPFDLLTTSAKTLLEA